MDSGGPAAWRYFDGGNKSRSLDSSTHVQRSVESPAAHRPTSIQVDSISRYSGAASSFAPESVGMISPGKVSRESLGMLGERFKQMEVRQSPKHSRQMSELSSAQTQREDDPNQLARVSFLTLPHIISHLQGLLDSPARLESEWDVTAMMVQSLQALALSSLRAAPQSLPSVLADVSASNSTQILREATGVLGFASTEPDARTIILEQRSALRRLPSLLEFSDEIIRRNVSLIIGNMCLEDVGRCALLASGTQVVSSLLLLCSSPDQDSIRNSIFALKQLSCLPLVLATIVSHPRGVSIIESLIDSEDKMIAKFSTRILTAIVTHMKNKTS